MLVILSYFQGMATEQKPFNKLHPRLWILEDKLPNGNMPRAMVAYRSAPGELLLHSVIDLTENNRREMEAWAEPKHMIVPSGLHRLDAPKYAARYSGLKIYAPEGARRKVEEKVRVDATCEEALSKIAGVTVHKMPGVKSVELAYEFDLGDGTSALVFNDVMMNMAHVPGVGGFIMKMLGSIGPLGPTQISKMLLIESRGLFAEWLEMLATRGNIRFVTVSHGNIVQGDVSAALRGAAKRARS